MSNFKRKFAAFLSCAFIISFAFSWNFRAAAMAPTDDDTLQEVRQLLSNQYVDQLSEDTLNLPTVDQILTEINKTDPHTKYFSAKDFTDFVSSIDNKFFGIGVQIQMVAEGVQVITVFDNSPAKEAGIKSGDIIMMAGIHILAGLPDDVAISYIKGPEGTSVKLKIKRGTQLLSLDVSRRQISVPTVEGKVLNNHTGYIRIVSFGADTGLKFGEILAQQQKANVDSYIVDLRNNGGGYLETAIDIAGYFIGKQTAVITRSRMDGEEDLIARYHTNAIDKPVVFLINEYSASASEVLSGAVKDFDKAYFMGVKSYGKGSVQTTPRLNNGDYLKLTIAKFYSPKGNEINHVGITPDMEVLDKVDAMRVAELLFDTPKKIIDTNGYVRVETGGKTITMKLSRAKEENYWGSYGQLLMNASKQGSVSLGNGKGWVPATKAQMDDIAKLYYPGYRLVSKLKNVQITAPITVKFSEKIAKNSLSAKNTELIDAESGKRIQVVFKNYGTNQVQVVPKVALAKGGNYWLVVNPTLVKADKKPLGTGMILELSTIADMTVKK